MTEYKDLKPYLLMDFWEVSDAWALLAGFKKAEHNFSEPKLIALNTGNLLQTRDYSRNLKNPAYQEALEKIETIEAIWRGSNHNEDAVRHEWGGASYWQRDYCIGWAKKKWIEIPWLDWAIENKYLPQDVGCADVPPPVSQNDLHAYAARSVKQNAQNAASARHLETYRIKESLRLFHKDNRHRFLNEKRRLNQTKAAKEATKLEPISQKKAAEYMGEFEKEFLKQ